MIDMKDGALVYEDQSFSIDSNGSQMFENREVGIGRQLTQSQFRASYLGCGAEHWLADEPPNAWVLEGRYVCSSLALNVVLHFQARDSQTSSYAVCGQAVRRATSMAISGGGALSIAITYNAVQSSLSPRDQARGPGLEGRHLP
jgi:hypothetical protein